MMAGRFAGWRFFQRISSPAFLIINTCISLGPAWNSVFFTTSGCLTAWLLVPLGLFNAVLFPVLFAVSLHSKAEPTCFEGAIDHGDIGRGADTCVERKALCKIWFQCFNPASCALLPCNFSSGYIPVPAVTSRPDVVKPISRVVRLNMQKAFISKICSLYKYENKNQ